MANKRFWSYICQFGTMFCQMRKPNKILRWWVTPKLPLIHLNKGNQEQKNVLQIINQNCRRWVVHPIKRRFAKYYLAILRKLFGLKVVGITGSSGKTTTKEMLSSILRTVGSTVYSLANIDPVYNIPSAILRCRPKTKFLVLEFGVEYPGEMNFYLWLARPDVGVITNIFPTHTEFFLNTKGVFKEKSKLAKGIRKEGTVVINSQDRYLRKFSKRLKAKVVWFGDGGNAESSKERITVDLKTKFILTLNSRLTESSAVKIDAPGYQFVSNALAASLVAESLGVSLKNILRGLKHFDIPDHRMRVIRHRSGALIIDDSYNNNPAAAKEALSSFNALLGKRRPVVVFGDMLELGRLERKYHLELGKLLSKYNLARLICVGRAAEITAREATKHMASNKVYAVADWESALPLIKPALKSSYAILIKGSRSISLDKIVSRLS